MVSGADGGDVGVVADREHVALDAAEMTHWTDELTPVDFIVVWTLGAIGGLAASQGILAIIHGA